MPCVGKVVPDDENSDDDSAHQTSAHLLTVARAQKNQTAKNQTAKNQTTKVKHTTSAVWTHYLFSRGWAGCAAMPRRFRPAVVKDSTTIQAGYMASPLSVTVRNVCDCRSVHMANNDAWLCQAINASSRGRHPMKGITFLQDVCKHVADKSAAKPQNHGAQESAADPRYFDPMADLEACSALADLSTPEKRPRRSRSKRIENARDALV